MKKITNLYHLILALRSVKWPTYQQVKILQSGIRHLGDAPTPRRPRIFCTWRMPGLLGVTAAREKSEAEPKERPQRTRPTFSQGVCVLS